MGALVGSKWHPSSPPTTPPKGSLRGRIADVPGELKVLTARHLPDLQALVDRDPVGHCFVASRLAEPMAPWALGGQIWGWFERDHLRSALYTGANLIPIESTPTARTAFAEHARRIGRRCSSIVGRSDEVVDLWRQLAAAWGPPREVRPQHLMATSQPAARPPDPRLRPLRIEELDLLMPAAVAMFTEEVGYSPVQHGGGPAYRARLADLVRAGRALAVVEGDRILFKAEIGSTTPVACQVQGVWVDPEVRGHGLGVAGMAAVVNHARTHLAPIVSLYVNDYNHAAVAAYEAVGFTIVGAFTTILF